MAPQSLGQPLAAPAPVFAFRSRRWQCPIMFADDMLLLPRDGRQSETALMIQRGVGRHLRALGLSMVTELPLSSGRRADIVAMDADGEIWIVEIKSSIEDFRVDLKWPEYRRHCDRLYFATHTGVPQETFPEDSGLIIADAYGADITRHAPEHRLSGATRRALLLRFARAAAGRLHHLYDPLINAEGQDGAAAT